MIENLPSLGARFDLHKVGTEQNCWQVFWAAVRPDQISGASLYEGSVNRGDYCIALQSSDPAMVEFVRHSLSRSSEFNQVCCEEPFVEGEVCAAMPLPRTGRVDEHGALIGDDKRMVEPVTAPVSEVQEEISLDVLDSASTFRKKPASDRTADLPDLEDFESFAGLVRDRFVCHQPGYDRDLWITPKELCDLVEKYKGLVEVGLSSHNGERAENALRVRIFAKDRPEVEPFELEGLYMFKSRYAVTQFLQNFISTPRYSDALPDLAGILGRFHLHFGQPRPADEKRNPPDYSKEERVDPRELWPRLLAIRESFGDELNRAVDALKRRREADYASANPILEPEPEIEHVESEPEAVEIPEEVLQELKRKREEEKARQEAEAEARRREVELEIATQEIRRSQGRCVYCGKPLGFADKLKKLDRHKDCWEYLPE